MEQHSANTPFQDRKYNANVYGRINHYSEQSLLSAQKFFEKKFLDIINDLGTFKIKKAQSQTLLIPYYKIKLQCNTGRFTYETIVIGDEFDREEDARENVFRKAYFILQQKYKQESNEIEKSLRRNNYF